MKTVVLYKSKTGYAKKYAQWIAKELNSDLFDAAVVNIDKLNTYDAIIFGGSLYAVGINGVKLITENTAKLQGKKLVVFTTGLSIPSDEVINEVRDKNFSPEQQKMIKFFYLRGGFDYNKLPIIDKILMRLLRWKILKKKNKGEELTSDEKGMLAVFDKQVDFTKEKTIEEIVTYIRESNA